MAGTLRNLWKIPYSCENTCISPKIQKSDPMKQLGLTDTRLMKRSKKTRKEQFLEEMEAIVPWQRLLSAIEPFYPKAARGRRRIPLETMLRIHLLQHFFNYSDPAMEEALYEVPLYCQFVGLDLAVDTVPDETTICKFRHLLEAHRLADVFIYTDQYGTGEPGAAAQKRYGGRCHPDRRAPFDQEQGAQA